MHIHIFHQVPAVFGLEFLIELFGMSRELAVFRHLVVVFGICDEIDIVWVNLQGLVPYLG